MKALMMLKLVDAGKLGGWVRALVAAMFSIIIVHWPVFGMVMDSDTQAAIGVAVSSIVVGLWSHYAKQDVTIIGKDGDIK